MAQKIHQKYQDGKDLISEKKDILLDEDLIKRHISKERIIKYHL